MAITLFEQSQIRGFLTPTGVWAPTGWVISGNLTVSGIISGTSGNIANLSVQTLDVSGAIRSPYLSGILGNNVTGSGIVHFLSVVDVSGNNVHFVLDIHTGDRNSPIYQASSSDNQNGWFFYDDGLVWQDFPAVGLSSAQQDSSVVRHVFSPTGLTVYNQLFAEIRPLFAGNVTGGYTNSYNFIPNANGFHIGMLTNLEELFNTADSRYVRKLLVGNTAVATGVDISGLNINLPTYATIPTGIFPTGRIISVSGLTYVFENRLGYTGFVSQVPFTGFSVPSGGMLTGTNIIVSGDGQVQTRIAGNNIIVVSGGGVNQFAVAAGPFRQGNMILSGSSSITITSGATASGTLFTFSLPGGAGGGGVTGIGVNLNTPLWTGGFVISGESGTSVRIANVGGNVSGIIIGSLPPSPGGVTGFSNVFQTPLFTGGLVISGAGGITTSLLNLGNNTTGIVISSLPAGVTGFGLAALSLFTGSFIVSGQNNLTVTLANMGNNTSGFIIDDSYLNDQLTLQMWNMVGY